MTDYYGLPRTIILSLFIYSIFAFVVSVYKIILYRLIYKYKNYQYKNHFVLDGISISQEKKILSSFNSSSLENKTWYRKDGRLVSI